MVGYDKRNENLEKALGVVQADWDNLLRVVDPKQGQNILDLMGGSGTMATKIYEFVNAKGLDLSLQVMDAYGPQLERAPRYLDKKLGDVRDIPLPNESLDTVVIKMGLHELPLMDQCGAAKEIYRVLKPGGKFVNWMTCLVGERQQEVFQWLIREKDRLTGLDDFVKNRYFPTVRETEDYTMGAGFKNIKNSYENNSVIESLNRLQGDFKGEVEKLDEYHEAIRGRWVDVIETLGGEDRGNNILTNHPICLLEAIKYSKKVHRPES